MRRKERPAFGVARARAIRFEHDHATTWIGAVYNKDLRLNISVLHCLACDLLFGVHEGKEIWRAAIPGTVEDRAGSPPAG